MGPRLSLYPRFAGLVAAAAALAGCDTLPTGPADSPADRIRGFNFADWTAAGYGTAAAMSALDEVAATGANSISIVITAYQSSPSASSIRLDDSRTASVSAVTAAVQRAHARGMSVTLKPHVDLDDGTWRGHIDPADPAAWFADYGSFVRDWVSLATALGIEGFEIGTELAGTLQHETRWRDLIDALRAAFPGDLTYAASWDEVHLVPFWKELDYVGVDFYFPVARRTDPSRLELLAGWQPWLDRLARLHERTGRPILVTEIGYRSVDGAAMRPHEFGSESVLDHEEQADLYWAALEATGAEDWIAGIRWWNWLAAGRGGPGDSDYTPRRKPAEAVLTQAWAGS